jgi:hypothetical protein
MQCALKDCLEECRSVGALVETTERSWTQRIEISERVKRRVEFDLHKSSG